MKELVDAYTEAIVNNVRLADMVTSLKAELDEAIAEVEAANERQLYIGQEVTDLRWLLNQTESAARDTQSTLELRIAALEDELDDYIDKINAADVLICSLQEEERVRLAETEELKAKLARPMVVRDDDGQA